MEKRRLGSRDVEVSVIGMGGIVVSAREQADVDRHVARAVERGVTYFDVSPDYGDAELRLGPALEPHRREVVLACKTGKRTAGEAREELDRSLRRLRTDHFDLYQIHGLCTLDEVDQAMGPDGAIETLRRAKRDGLTRLIGFSSHNDAAALRAMECEEFDTVLFPLNYLSLERNGVGARLLEAAGKRGMGILAIKVLARTKVPEGGRSAYPKCWYVPEDRPDVARLQLRYTLGLPGVAAAVPPGDAGLFDMALDAGDPTAPLSEAERGELRAATAQYAPLWDAS